MPSSRNATNTSAAGTSRQPSPKRSVRLSSHNSILGMHAETSQHLSPRRSARLSPRTATPSTHGGDDEALTKAVKNFTKSSVNQAVPRYKKAATSFQLIDEPDNQDPGVVLPKNASQRTEVRRSLDLMAGTHTQNTTITPPFVHVEHDEEVSGDDVQQQEQTSASSQAAMKKRGSTRCLTTAKKRRDTASISIEIDECAGRLVGPDSQHLITKGGCITRQFAKFDGTGWKHQEDDLKNKIIDKCTENLDYDGNLNVKKAIYKQLAIQYKARQYKLHLFFLKFPSKEEAMNHIPENVPEYDWINLCNYFVSDTFKDRSQRAKQNRAKNKTPPANGSVSIARVVHGLKSKGEEVSCIDRYEIAHFSQKKRKMVNEHAKNILAEMREEEAIGLKTPAEICIDKVHNIPGNVKGVAAPRKRALEVERLEIQINQERERTAEVEERSTWLTEKVAAQQEELNTLKDQMNAMVEKMAEMARLQTGSN